MHDDAARLEHIRRWVRPDFERFLRPDWERYVHPAGHEAVRRQIAECKAAFEPWQARRLREQNEARERELEAEHEREIERAALELKAELAALRVELLWAELRRKAGFDPDQPRDEQGRWTDSGENEGVSGGRENSNEDPAPEQVQDGGDRLLNNHIIRNHVAKTDEELKARIRAEQLRGLFARSGMDRNGSFDSIESARDFISETIANNPSDVAEVAGGRSKVKFLVWRFGYHTGREAIMDFPGSEIRMRPTYEVGVLIVHDPRADFGYRIANAFPRNFNPRTGR